MTAIAIPPRSADVAIDLVAQLRQAAASGVTDAYILAERMIADWSDEQCRVMLSALLPGYLRGIAEQSAEAVAIQEVRERMTRPRPEAPAVNRVTTAQRVNSWYTQTLAAKVATGDGDGWKYLADCTADDLLQASARLHTKAIRLSRLADALRDEGVRTVGQLSEPVLRAVLDEKS